MDFLEIDGSFGEGGGSILRLSSAFSLLFEIPVHITNIRANRSKPGLRLQHLLGLKTLAELTHSELSECQVGTQEITLIPHKKEIKNNIKVDIRTAASIGLLLQPLQIMTLGLNSDEITIKLNGGGTYGKWAPSVNYLNKVTYRIFKYSGLDINIDIKKHGFYPKGGARSLCTINPPNQKKLNPIDITELGNLSQLQGKIIVTKHLQGRKIPERIKRSFHKEINKNLSIDTNISHKYVDSLSPGVGLEIWSKSDTGAIISSGTIIGEKHISSEQLGKMAAGKILQYIEHNIPVDNYLSDQLIPLMAYIDGTSKIKVQELNSHTKTNLKLLEKFVEREYHVQELDTGFIIEYV
ncbi:MAG: RNA 3'-terminal phosphate cyclase [Promethearchaeia archaeon]